MVRGSKERSGHGSLSGVDACVLCHVRLQGYLAHKKHPPP